jgi:hypothetical protein
VLNNQRSYNFGLNLVGRDELSWAWFILCVKNKGCSITPTIAGILSNYI